MSSIPGGTTHLVEVDPYEFVAIHTGRKTFYITLLLENMNLGDHVLFKEFTITKQGRTHRRSTLKKITYIQCLVSSQLYVIALNEPDEYYL